MSESTLEKMNAETGGDATVSDETIAVSSETPERHRREGERAPGADPPHSLEPFHRSMTTKGPASAFKPDPFW